MDGVHVEPAVVDHAPERSRIVRFSALAGLVVGVSAAVKIFTDLPAPNVYVTAIVALIALGVMLVRGAVKQQHP